MFNKKKEDKNGEWHLASEEKLVSCNTCKCLLKEEDSQIVKSSSGVEFYCFVHKKPYSRCIYGGFYFNQIVPPKYYKEIEVDEKGEPIGYVKIKPKVQVTKKKDK